SSATASTNLAASVASGVTLEAGGAITIVARSDDDALAVTKGIGVSGLVGIGGAFSFATVRGSARAEMNGVVLNGGSLSVTSIATDIANATAFALSGGLLVAGSAAVATARLEKDAGGAPTARAALASGTVTDAGDAP